MAEQRPEFPARKAKATMRGKAGLAAAAQRAANLVEWAQTVEIASIDPPADAKTAIRLGTKSWEKWNGQKAKDADAETRIRWARNYLRHECMSYEGLIYDETVPGTIREAYHAIRSRCEGMIDQRYPALK